jgi:hypothetical protein
MANLDKVNKRKAGEVEGGGKKRKTLPGSPQPQRS